MNWKHIIGFIIFVDIFLPFVLNIMNIPQNTYLNYLIFVNALFIFYIILPSNVGSMFL